MHVYVHQATIFARLMSASRITMWKNVNGVYTADPRVVPETYSIPELKYDEAIELAYFGAQVLHPSAMAPLIEGGIPLYVKDVFNPELAGTVIKGRACSVSDCKSVNGAVDNYNTGSPIKGITSINKVALLTVEGTGTSAVPDLTERLFSAMRVAGISPLMHTQASAESSICIVVNSDDAQAATDALESVFERELERGLIASITTEYDHEYDSMCVGVSHHRWPLLSLPPQLPLLLELLRLLPELRPYLPGMPGLFPLARPSLFVLPPAENSPVR